MIEYHHVLVLFSLLSLQKCELHYVFLLSIPASALSLYFDRQLSNISSLVNEGVDRMSFTPGCVDPLIPDFDLFECLLQTIF